MKYRFDTIKELDIWVQNFVENLKPKNQATIIRLSGDLGSGKTTLTQLLAKCLGIIETVTSPTFVVQKQYKVLNHNWIQDLIHIDAYRLEGKKDLEYLGWQENIMNPANVVIIEWPEIVEGINMPESILINLEINRDTSRTLSIQNL